MSTVPSRLLSNRSNIRGARGISDDIFIAFRTFSNSDSVAFSPSAHLQDNREIFKAYYYVDRSFPQNHSYTKEFSTYIFLKCMLRFSSSSGLRSYVPTKVFSLFVLKKMVLLHMLAIAAARNLRRALNLCSRVTISGSISPSLAESPMTHEC